MNKDAPQSEHPHPGLTKLWKLSCAVLLVAFLLMVPIPIKGRMISSGMDLVHAPLFATLTWIILRGLQGYAAGHWLPASLLRRFVYVALPLGLCGAAIEGMQATFGRGPSWHDAGANFCGAIAGVLLFELSLRWNTRVRPLLILAICVMIALPSFDPLRIIWDCLQQRREFPLLASFETDFTVRRFVAQDARVRRTTEFATDGDWGLEIELLPGKYSGVFLDGIPGDWSRYQTLQFDLHVDEGPMLDLIVKVFDTEHPNHHYDETDRFDRMLQLTPGRHHISIPLSEVESAPQGRFMKMDQIQAWQIFCYGLKESRTLVLDNLRLTE